MSNDLNPKIPGEEVHEATVQLGRVLPEELRHGIYANELSVTALRDEVVLDFIRTTVGPPSDREDLESEVVARIFVSHSLANRIKTLFARLEFKDEASKGDNDAKAQNLEARQDGTAG